MAKPPVDFHPDARLEADAAFEARVPEQVLMTVTGVLQMNPVGDGLVERRLP
jgi:hypothetical protein